MKSWMLDTAPSRAQNVTVVVMSTNDAVGKKRMDNICPELRTLATCVTMNSRRHDQKSFMASFFECFRSHHTLLRQVFADMRAKHGGTIPETELVLVCEDDCAFLPSVGGTLGLLRLLSTCAKTLSLHCPDWCVLFMGSFHYAPMIPVSWSTDMFVSPCGALSHCQLLRAQWCCAAVESTRREDWGPPMHGEFWFSVPLFKRFALWPSVAVQTEPPSHIWNVVRTMGLPTDPQYQDLYLDTITVAFHFLPVVVVLACILCVRHAIQRLC